MTKQDLITVVGSKTGQNDSHVRPIIEATLDAIKECVQRKEPVYLRGFGTFQPKKRAERKPVTLPPVLRLSYRRTK